MKRKLLATALVISLLAGAAMAQPAPGRGGDQVLNVRDADIRVFIQDVSRATGITFIIDPRVRGQVTVVSNGALTPRQLFDVFLSTLRANGFVAIPTGSGAYRVQPVEGAAQQGSVAGGVFSTEVFRLRSVDATSAAETIKPFVGPQGQVTADAAGNLLIVADYADNMRRVRGLIRQIDIDRASIQVIPLTNISAREAAQVVNQLLAPQRGEGPRGGGVVVAPVVSSNSIMLRGDPEMIRRVAPVLAELDRQAAAASDIQVVFLQHASAEQLLPVLRQLVGQPAGPTDMLQAPQAPASTAATTATPTARTPASEPQESSPPTALSSAAGAPRATIVRYAGANALVISGDPNTQRTLATVIRQLDTPRQQVLVEAIVVEVSDTAARQLGVQFLLAGRNGSAVPFAASSYSGSGPNLLAITGAVAGGEVLPENSVVLQNLREAAINSLIGAGALLGLGGQGDDATFGLILNAVRQDNASNLLSTPSVMTLNNTPATILVGQEVPITTGEVLGDSNSNPFRTIQRQNVGIRLDVTPQIGAGGVVTLALRQEVSAVAGPVSASFSELVVNKREITTTVTVSDGQVVVLGGLLDQNQRVSVERVPVLGDIPGIGVLFRSTGRERTRTNLLIFIRPRIINSPEAAAAVTGQRYEQMRGEPGLIGAAGENALDDHFEGYLGTELPVAPQPTAPGAAP